MISRTNSLTLTISQRSLVVQAYIWLLAPLLLFLVNWFRWEISIPVLILLGASVAKVFCQKREGMLHFRNFRETDYEAVRIDRKWWLIMGLAAVYVFINGYGGFYYQIPYDNGYRNALMQDISTHPWPVEYAPLDGRPRLLSYYLGFWLAPALIAKITGSLLIGEVSLLLYAIWGTWIALNFIHSLCGGRALWSTLLIFIFFNIWDFPFRTVENYFLDPDYFQKFPFGHHDWIGLDFGCVGGAPSNRVMYGMSINQGPSTWVALMLMWHERRKLGNLLFNFALLPLLAPFPAVCIIAYVGAKLILNFKKSISLPNFAGMTVCLLILFYYLSNPRGEKPGVLEICGSSWVAFGITTAFTIVAYGVYLPFIWKEVKGSVLFWSMVVTAWLVPMVDLGSGDLGNRLSFSLVIYIMTLLSVKASRMKAGFSWRKVAFSAVFAVGAFLPVYQIGYCLLHELKCLRSGESVKSEWLLGHLDDKEANGDYLNFISEGESFYSRYLMPHKN